LFETRSARPYTTRRVQQIVREVADEARLGGRVYPHLLRHELAPHLLERGMPLDQVQLVLGHSKIETTQIYAQATTAMVRASYERAMVASFTRWRDRGTRLKRACAPRPDAGRGVADAQWMGRGARSSVTGGGMHRLEP
jgi:hypothetical protein